MIKRKTGALVLLTALALTACGEGESRVNGSAGEAPDARLDPQGMAAGQQEAPQTVAAAPAVDQRSEAADDESGDHSTSYIYGRSGGNAMDPDQPVERSSASGGDGDGVREAQLTASTDGAAEPEPPSRDASPDTILRATSRAYEGLRSFRARFEQTLRNTLLGRTTRSEGTLYQRQPDRFLMEFSDPPEDRIVSDGEYFWMHFPSVDRKQVIRSRRGAQGLDLHSQFIGDPVRRFETTYHGTEAVRGRRVHVMTLVPRENLGYQRLKVWVDANDHLVRRFELTEGNGNIRRFELSDLTKNPSLSDDLFRFTPPAGSQVVER